MWEHATNALKEACARHELAYDINEGDGAFYGPKIDIKVKDAIGRTWQCSTVQVDFNMPERFELTYRTEDNTEERPWMLHRAIFGSIERFLGILIEHYAGALPLWLAPVQVAVLPLVKKDGMPEVAQRIVDDLKYDYNVVYDEKDSVGKRYRRQDAIGTPFCVTVDGQTLEDGTVTVRHRDTMEQERVMIESLPSLVEEECSYRKLFRKMNL